MNMSKNSREHYCGVPTKDELMDSVGSFSTKVLAVLAGIVLIILLL